MILLLWFFLFKVLYNAVLTFLVFFRIFLYKYFVGKSNTFNSFDSDYFIKIHMSDHSQWKLTDEPFHRPKGTSSLNCAAFNHSHLYRTYAVEVEWNKKLYCRYFEVLPKLKTWYIRGRINGKCPELIQAKVFPHKKSVMEEIQSQ